MTPHEIYQVATNSFDIWGVSIGSRIFKNEMFDNQSDLTYGGYTCPNVHIQKNFILMHKGDSPINLIYCNSISLALSPENTNEVLAISRHQAYNSSFPGGGDPPLISVFLNSIFEKYGPPTFKTSDENGVTDYYWSTFYKNKKDRVALGGEVAAADTAFTALCNALNDDANIVELAVKNNLEALLNTGYLPASDNRSQSPLDDTAIQGLFNNGTTQLLLRLLPVRNAQVYQVQSSIDGGKTWVEAGLPSTQARRVVLTGLIPATTYLVRARAIGGSTGASAWTAPGTIICT